MPSLVVAEHDNKVLSEATARTVTATLQLGRPVHVLVAGYGCGAPAAAAARLQGVERVLIADDPLYAPVLAEPLAALIARLAAGYDVVAAPATSDAKSMLPRVAALLDVPQISEITKILKPDTFERPIYAGSAIQTVKAAPGKIVLTVRPTAFAVAESGAPAPVTAIAAGPDPGLSKFEGATPSQAAGPDLSTAKIVVSGGRGVQTAANFKLLERIAGRLGAALGGSRAAVEAGFVGNEFQVGQTGKVVAPALYIAAGISGAIQHLSGMKDSRIIVAINKDEDAPIFQIADIGLVADLARALPELDAELARRGYR